MVAGNVAEDLAPGGGWVPGGPALYAARMALSLGARVDLITRLTDDYDRSVLDGLDVTPIHAEQSCRYANTYDSGGDRTQLLLAEGQPIDPGVVERVPADACMLAPAYHEFNSAPNVRARVRAVSLQGALRATDERQRVIHHPNPMEQVQPFLAARNARVLQRGRYRRCTRPRAPHRPSWSDSAPDPRLSRRRDVRRE